VGGGRWQPEEGNGRGVKNNFAENERLFLTCISCAAGCAGEPGPRWWQPCWRKSSGLGRTDGWMDGCPSTAGRVAGAALRGAGVG